MLICPRCRRANPDDAVFCHHDGIELRTADAPTHPSGVPDRFAREWRFPSGRSCASREELVQGCLAEWEAASAAYADGRLGRFLREASHGTWMPPPLPIDVPDEAALQTLLEQLADPERRPRPFVELVPRRLQFDVRAGATAEASLRISNRGEGYLTGSVEVGNGANWIQLEGSDGIASKQTIAARHEQTIAVRILGRNLPASGSYLGKLLLRSNGGTLELPVLANLIGGGGFHGYSVGSPRELAKLFRDRPRDALTWFENGSVARWFADNGLPYPVQDPTAPGLGAIQQLFEALGLARTPEIHPEERELHLICRHPEEIEHAIVLKTSEEKWVYAFWSCREFWIRFASDAASGPRKVEIPFTIDSGLLEAGKVYETMIHLTANGGQTFKIKVTVDVRRPHEPFTRRILRPFLSN